MMNTDYSYGCASCMAGTEKSRAKALGMLCPEIETLIPEKLRIRRIGKDSKIEKIVLFPGYIFFRLPALDEIDLKLFAMSHIHVLSDSEGVWKLRGNDLELVESFFAAGGCIGFSEAFFDENQKIRIVDGFLKGHEGDITRVNRRARTVEVRVSLNGKVFTIWLGYEEVEREPTETDAR